MEIKVVLDEAKINKGLSLIGKIPIEHGLPVFQWLSEEIQKAVQEAKQEPK